jgi:hypothetical protein
MAMSVLSSPATSVTLDPIGKNTDQLSREVVLWLVNDFFIKVIGLP